MMAIVSKQVSTSMQLIYHGGTAVPETARNYIPSLLLRDISNSCDLSLRDNTKYVVFAVIPMYLKVSSG